MRTRPEEMIGCDIQIIKSISPPTNKQTKQTTMMKLKAIGSILLIASEASAFSSPHHCTVVRQTACYGTVRPDASEAIEHALQVSKKYGPTSKEARLAWDTVEEMDSNDSSPAYASGQSKSVDAPQDYYDHINSLSYLLKDTSSKFAQMKELVAQIKALELKDPSLARLPDKSSGPLKRALSEAKAAVAVYGAGSAEARQAWDTLDNCFGEGNDGVLELVEECDIEPSQATYRYSAAALEAHHMYDAAIESAVLEEALEALGMLEGLAKFVNVEKRRLDAREKSLGP